MKKFILFVLATTSCITASSQVYNAGTMLSIYHDIDPDTVLNYVVTPFTNEVYSIDLFGVMAADIEIIARGSVSSGGSAAFIRVGSLSPDVYMRFGRWDSVYVPADAGWDVTKVADPLSMGDAINDGSATWDNTELYFTDHSGHGGGNKDVNDWIGGNYYLGLKHQDGNATAYGWLRIHCTSEDSCYLKDYSLSASTVGFKDAGLTTALLYPNPGSTVFYLYGISSSTLDISTLTLADLYGNTIDFTSTLTGDELMIYLYASLADGYYLLRYDSQDRAFSKKLVKSSR